MTYLHVVHTGKKRNYNFKKIDESMTLVSFDVVSLFTKVPIDETLTVLERKLADSALELGTMRVETIKDLLRLCLTTTYFAWNGKMYEQTEGAAMGNPLSPVVANIFMEHFEELAITSAPVKPAIWLRYVDDTFVVWREGREKLEEFLHHLNALRPSIKFTMELEEKDQLPFLDVLVKKKENRLTTTVYRKKTHTDRYIHFTSNHHPSTKLGVMKCLKTRAERICDKKHIRKEIQHIKEVFMKNGYPRSLINKALRKRPMTDEAEQQDREERRAGQPRRNTPCFLPYVKGTSERIGKICRKYGLQPVFHQRNSLRSILTRVKDPQKTKDKGVVYRIPCGECSEVYIGETGRPLKMRIGEHRRAVEKKDMKNANAVHSEILNHRINWEESTVVEREERMKQRRIKESIHIRRSRSYNLDEGYPLSPVWDILIKDI